MKDSTTKPITTTIDIYSRHIPKCPGAGDPYYKGRDCNCQKWLYVNAGGQRRRYSAKTRYWKHAEKAASEVRRMYDPEVVRLREKEEWERRQVLVEAQKQKDRMTIELALHRWLARHKGIGEGTQVAYKAVVNKINRWSQRVGITYLDGITTDQLDAWRSSWRTDADEQDDRMGATAQATFQSRLKRFFKYAVAMRWIAFDPSAALSRIKPNDKRTIPLTKEQFKTLTEAIRPFCGSCTNEAKGFANEFRAIFMTMRYTGLRLIDVLSLRRTSLVGNRLRLRTQKTKAEVDRIIPDEVASYLQALSRDRFGFKPEFFLWAKGCAQRSLSVKWAKHIDRMDKGLNFKDEHGDRFKFHSHMLRDTFAVEMLLAGLSLEEVAKLLTDTVAITEKYYGFWSKDRKELLQERQIAALRSQGMVVSP